jgi:opacity protein-like surface antigen
MRKSNLMLGAILVSSILSSAAAFSADQDMMQAAGGYYGNVHAAVAADVALTSPVIFVPYLNLGGKVAYDGGPGSFGTQFDMDLDYTNLSWISPSITTSSVNLTTIDSAAHLTYIVTDNNKIGAFVGASSLTLSASGSSLTAGLLGFGVEDVVAINDETSFQVRAALLGPAFISGTYDDGTGPQSASALLDTGVLGYSVMGGVSHKLTSNISARLDASYVKFGSDLGLYNGAITGQYTFDTMPMTFGVTAGYGAAGFAGLWSDNVSLSAKATYSFGAPSSGVTGKLFRSGLFSLLN